MNRQKIQNVGKFSSLTRDSCCVKNPISHEAVIFFATTNLYCVNQFIFTNLYYYQFILI